MEFKLTKRKIGYFLEKNWGYLILLIALPALIMNFSINSINSYKDFESIYVFVTAKNIKKDFSSEIKEEYLNKVNNFEIHMYNVNDSSLSNLYEANGVNSDFIILPERDANYYLDSDLKNPIYMEYSQELKNAIFDGIDSSSFIYKSNELNGEFALKIFDKDDQNYNDKINFESWFEFDSTYSYYLLLNRNSKKFGEFSESENKIALDSLNYIFRSLVK